MAEKEPTNEPNAAARKTNKVLAAMKQPDTTDTNNHSTKAGVTGVSSETAPDYGTTQGAITPDRIRLLLQNERCEIDNTIAGIHGIANVLNNELLEDIQSRDAQLLVEGLVRLTSRLYDAVGEVPEDTVQKIKQALTEPDNGASDTPLKSASQAEFPNIEQLPWGRIQALYRKNRKRPIAEIRSELNRGQWEVLDRHDDDPNADRYLVQHSWSRKGLDHMLAVQQYLDSIWCDAGETP